MKRPSNVPASALISLAVAMSIFLLGCIPGQDAESVRSPRETPTPAPSETGVPPAEQVGNARASMSALTSFRVGTADKWGWGVEFERIIEFSAPDSYHHRTGDDFGSIAIGWEELYHGDTLYSRYCGEWEGEPDCYPWTADPRYDYGLIDGAGQYGHLWLLAALEIIGDLTVVEDSERETRDMVHIRGTLNPLEAQYEAERRALGAWGTGPNGNPCYPPKSDSEPGSCEEFDIERLKSGQAYRSYEAVPRFLDLWLEPETGRVKIYSIRPDQDPYSNTQTYRYEYLDYEGVAVVPPPPEDIES